MVRIQISIKQLDPYQIEKQDPDPDQYQSEKQDQDPQHWCTVSLLLSLCPPHSKVKHLGGTITKYIS
jgi:hypothetical protein